MRYINWYKLGSRYGCFAMKERWQSRLINILAIVLEILVLIFAPWLDFGNSNKKSIAFFLLNVSFCLWCFHLCCVENNNFCMSYGIILVIFFGKSYNWTWRTWTWDVRLELKDCEYSTRIMVKNGWGMHVIC